MTQFERKDDFSAEEYAAIGRLLVAVTTLDDVIGRSCLKMLKVDQTTQVEAGTEKQAVAAMSASGTSRYKLFKSTLTAAGLNRVWYDENDAAIENILKWRNALCHSRYSRGSCGAIRLEFFDKDSIKNARLHPEECLTITDANALANEANRLNFEIHERLLKQ